MYIPSKKKDEKTSWDHKPYQILSNHQEDFPSLYDVARKEKSPLLPKDLPNNFGDFNY